MISFIASVLAFVPLLGVIFAINGGIRNATGDWFAKRKNRIWLLPFGFLFFYSLMAVLRQEWRLEIFLEIGLYFILPTLLVYFSESEGSKISWSDIALVLLIWMPTEFGIFPIHWGKIFGISYPAGVWCAVIFMFVVVSGRWRRLNLNCEWRFSLYDLKILLLTFAVIAYTIIPPALDIGFVKPGLKKEVVENWANSFLILAGIFFVIALTEELLFRGLIQNLLQLRMGATQALVAASMIFGLSHINNPVNNYGFPNWPYALFATVAGLGYGYVYQKTRSLVAAALLHTLVDFVWVIFFKA